MGLFSRKSKQDRVAEDSGRFYSKDDDAAAGARARAKRASNAGGGASARRQANDPMLPEKKRARRRLVGAIALALAVAVGLPMLLDSEPKPLAGDIAIQIPAKDKAAPLPVPSADKAVAAEDSVDQDEEIVSAPGASGTAKPSSAPAVANVADAVKPEAPKVERKPDAKADVKPEPKPEHKPDTRLAERERADRERAERVEKERAERADRERIARERTERERAQRAEHERAEKLARAKAEDKPVKPVSDSARAAAILEGKPVDRAADKDVAASQKFVLQVAAMSSAEKAAEVQAKLRDAGISSWTQKASTASGELIRVRIGPLSRDEAEKVRAKLGRLGLSGAMTPV
jgi:DedD protein